MKNRTEELVVVLTKKEKDFIIKSAEDKYLSIEDFIVLSVLSLDTSQKIEYGYLKRKI